MKRVYRSNTDKVFSGVIGGLGEYFDVDPVLLRLGYLILTVITGILPCIVVYIIASVIVPKRHADYVVHEHKTETQKSDSEDK